MKKWFCLLGIGVLLFTLTGCKLEDDINQFGGYLRELKDLYSYMGKEEIIEFVRNHEDELRKAVSEGDFSAFINQTPVQSITAKEREIKFYCDGAGIGSGTIYVGFIYMPEEIEKYSYWGIAPEPFGDGLIWKEESGDNSRYLEKISDNFYYYKDSY